MTPDLRIRAQEAQECATDKSSSTGIVRVGETKLVDISEHEI
jgi:hypothetical protein